MILGAGPAGIGAALPLGRDAALLEAHTSIGGLCGTLELGGAVFDVGGHSFHPEVRDLVFRSLEMCEQKRIARCYSRGALISYPFQAHFRQLRDPSIVEKCARGLRAATRGRGAAHLEGSLRERFGPGIARHFLLPYNRKLWARDLRGLSADWIPERVCGADTRAETPAADAGARRPLEEDTVVAYPARGGFGEILRALARQVRDFRPGMRATRVEPSRRRLVTEGGSTFAWDRLVSTLPLPELRNITQGVPESLRAAAGRLEHVSLKLVLVVVGRPVSTEVQRIYAAGRDIPAHKVVISTTRPISCAASRVTGSPARSPLRGAPAGCPGGSRSVSSRASGPSA